MENELSMTTTYLWAPPTLEPGVEDHQRLFYNYKHLSNVKAKKKEDKKWGLPNFE